MNGFNNGFDSIGNYAQCMVRLSPHVKYANTINTDPNFNVLSYISSHDASCSSGIIRIPPCNVGPPTLHAAAGRRADLYYGDESGRDLMKDGGVFDQAVRSGMNWSELASGEKAELVKHWQKLGNSAKDTRPSPPVATRRSVTSLMPLSVEGW